MPVKKKSSKKKSAKADKKIEKELVKTQLNISNFEVEDEPNFPKKRTLQEHMMDTQIRRRENFINSLHGDSSASATEEKNLLQSLSKRVKNEFSNSEIKDLKLAFDLFDQGSTGEVNFDELHRLLQFLRFDIHEADLRLMVDDLEVESTGKYGLEDLLVCVSSQDMARDVHMELKQGFRQFDLDRSGHVTTQTLRFLSKRAGLNFTEQEVSDMITAADKKG